MRRQLENILREAVGVRAGDGILAAVSGGPDSVALLHLLCSLAPDYPFSLRVGHLDHALREESASDARFVADLCRRLGVELVTDRIDVAAEARRRGTGVEEAARDLRRAFLERCAAAHGCRWIALGHHRGDQAETVLHRLLRGTSLPGLAGMRLRSGPYIRPLLAVPRERIQAYLLAEGLPWVEDRSNSDLRFTRNRIRHEVLPLLREFNPRIEEHLGRLGGRVSLEEDFWRTEEKRALAAAGRFDEEGGRLDRTALLALHPALRARVIRRAAGEVRGTLHGIAAAHLEGVEHLLAGGRPQGELHLPGLWVGLRYGDLRLRRIPPPPPAEFHIILSCPGRYLLPDGRVLHVETDTVPKGESAETVEFQAAGLTFPLVVRTFRAGDRFRPAGSPGRKKLKDFFIDRKVEREKRRALPLIEKDEILWVVGVCRCQGRNPEPGQSLLRLTVSSSETQTNRL